CQQHSNWPQRTF
nr:immunoglobulin light chain junction region [Macaca mulatta]MPN92246.1 immunoglobulin light chain junction region [Macaca mulatta]MPN93813.1 immunoglobulin light chain junction region [Macaca mulatta]MPN93881.1 immunoglobulin light chain junction region [Macaca mulatta]MPN95496.1 immunoglobulin light chain junction region [Macaca mulatta]